MDTCTLCGSSTSEPFFVKDGYELRRCCDCGLVWVANPPGPEDLARLYSYSSGYARESTTAPHALRRVQRWAVSHLEVLDRHRRPPGRLIDVGCSNGYFLEAATGRGWEAEGIDVNEDSVRVAVSRNLKARLGTLEDADFAAGSFDAVTLWDVIEHVPDPVRTLGLARSLLAPGGVLLLSTPNVTGLFPRLSYPLGRRTGYWPHVEPRQHLFQFSERTITRLLDRTGLRTVEVRHGRSPVRYTLVPEGPRALAKSPAKALYGAVFVGPLMLGPAVRAGDEIVVVAQGD
jgi:SAM-dependent methyltransferase